MMLKLNHMLRNKSVKNEIDNDKKTAYKEVLNKMIDKVNELKLLESSYASYFNKVNEILIELSDEIYEDSWLKLNELYNINGLLDEFIDKIWKLVTDKNKKADKKINIDKYLEIDRYVDEYTDITDGKIDIFTDLGSILSKALVEIQNKAYIINDLKQKENLDIKTLKTMHKTLKNALIKWMKTVSSAFKNNKFINYDMKPDRPSNNTKKPDTNETNKPNTNKTNKPDTHKPKTNKPNTNITNKHDTNKPNTNKTNKHDTNKPKTNKHDTNKPKTNKPDTNKTNEPQETNEP